MSEIITDTMWGTITPCKINRTNSEYLDESQLALRWQASKKFIQKLRYQGGGPKFVKIGRLVRYSLIDITEYENQNKCINTSQGAKQ
jgi:predicted DNA-binding transcriptional regulator AlpA